MSRSFPVTSRCHGKYGWISTREWVQGGTLVIHKVSCTLDNGQWSYKHFVFLGVMLKMAAQPCTHCDSNSNNLNNFWSQMGQDFAQQFSWESIKIPRRSLLKYATCKLPKMAVQFKKADFLLSLAHGVKRLFCRSGCDTYVHRFSSIYVKVGPGAAV